MKNIYYFYKDTVPEIDSITNHVSPLSKHQRPIGTYRYAPGFYHPWTQLIQTKQGRVYAKVALRNVPKKFKAMLLLMGVSYPT